MGLAPVVLWGLQDSVRDVPDADRHIQSYACSVARRLAQLVLANGRELFDGIFFYNACDTLRNLPEILGEGLGGGAAPPMFRMHLPMTSAEDPAISEYLKREITSLIHTLENAFGVRFSEQKFAASVAVYARMRKLARRLEEAVAEGRMSFSSFCEALGEANFLIIEDQVALFQSRLASLAGAALPDDASTRVVVSGILPPPPAICRLLDEAGLRVSGNDIASGFRSYAHTPETWADVGDYYLRFYRDHFPCTTLLYSADNRVPAVTNLVAERGAAGFVFVGEKFCEYEYFELPYLQARLQDAGIPVLSLELSIDDAANVETFRTRIQAFAELLADRTSGLLAREGA